MSAHASESKEAINVSSDVAFLEEFHNNPEMMKYLQKVNDHFGERIKNLVFPLIIERIVHRSVTTNKSAVIISEIEEYLQRYKQYELDTILNINIPNENNLNKVLPMFIYGHNKHGQPIGYDEIASANFTKLFETFSNSAIVNDDEKTDETHIEKVVHLLQLFRFKFLAKLAKCKQEQSMKYNTTIFRHILVMDFKNFSYTNLASNMSNFQNIAKPVIANEQKTFPESAYTTYLINCPFSFKLIWKIVSVWFDPVIKKKIKILGNKYLKEMLKDIDIDQIPKKYGGNGKMEICDKERNNNQMKSQYETVNVSKNRNDDLQTEIMESKQDYVEKKTKSQLSQNEVVNDTD
eukprot:189297_1